MGPLVNDTNGCPMPSPPVCNNATQIPTGSPQPLQSVTTAAASGGNDMFFHHINFQFKKINFAETVLPGEEEVTVPSICTGGEDDEENCNLYKFLYYPWIYNLNSLFRRYTKWS